MHLRWNGGAAAMLAVLAVAPAGAEHVSPQAVGCKLIRNVAQLQAISTGPAGNYCLANDIDLASATGFPIGSFGGKFFGNGHAIRNLTINNVSGGGLFGFANNAVIQDVRLINVNITSTGNFATVGGVAGDVSGLTTIARVHVSGQVTCTGNECYAGGIAGRISLGPVTLTESSSSAAITGPGAGVAVALVGGAVGQVGDINGTTITRTTATGNVRCGATTCFAGGLLGTSFIGLVDRSSASGTVTLDDGGYAGGLIGSLDSTVLRRSHASGLVNGGMTADTGGLVGRVDDGTVEESYSIGRVIGASGANFGGLIGNVLGTNTFTNIYWDRQTSRQDASAAGLQFATKEFRAQMPAGFGSSWGLTRGRSYPYLNDADIALTLPLATLISRSRVFTFLPISQLDESQYAAVPANIDAASLAAVYTMIARAIGVARAIPALADVKIDTYWNDDLQVATWKGALAKRATLGALTDIPAGGLNGSNVIGAMRDRKLVILRGTVPSGGSSTTHWMLGTLYAADSDGKVGAVVAHDPWTGAQVMIDPKTRRVVSPPDFPLSKFKVDGYQPVTLE